MNLQQAAPKAIHSHFKLKDLDGPADTRLVLKEIFKLLEDYGPVWYTEELHDRIKTALSKYR